MSNKTTSSLGPPTRQKGVSGNCPQANRQTARIRRWTELRCDSVCPHSGHLTRGHAGGPRMIPPPLRSAGRRSGRSATTATKDRVQMHPPQKRPAPPDALVTPAFPVVVGRRRTCPVVVGRRRTCPVVVGRRRTCPVVVGRRRTCPVVVGRRRKHGEGGRKSYIPPPQGCYGGRGVIRIRFGAALSGAHGVSRPA